mmetsp:Transcript_6667/g.12849  ORF Transcript_6667/g.12849 Transcript_6667/m.12849 type:complete len:435 (+) Transcript_6667:57-1361(+)
MASTSMTLSVTSAMLIIHILLAVQGTCAKKSSLPLSPQRYWNLAQIKPLSAGSSNKAKSTSSSSSTSYSGESYQPTSGVEERWVLEEEFHGASSPPREKLKEKRNQKNELSAPVPDDGRIGGFEEEWWDDDEDMDDDDSMSYRGKSIQYQNPDSSLEADKHPNKTRHRFRIWKNKRKRRENQIQTSSSSASRGAQSLKPSPDSNRNSSALSTAASQLSDYDEEHPLRTDEWELNIQLSRLYSKKEGDWFTECFIDRASINNNHGDNRPQVKVIKRSQRSGYNKRQVMQFATNGYVKVLEDGDISSTPPRKRSKTKVGKWRLGHSGVSFDIPVQIVNDDSQNVKNGQNTEPNLTVLHYHADIHLNKFGERPRMFRGVITRDRHSSFLPPNFLRPVIGTFSAEGIGRDTADTSYKDRGFGLSRQQLLQDSRSSNSR